MKSLVIGVALSGLVLASFTFVPAAAMDQTALNEAAKACINEQGGMAKAVEACSTVLDNAPSLSPQGKASVLFFRGSFLQELGRNQEAIVDLDRAIGIYETAADKESWSGDAKAKMASSYFYRAQAKEFLQRCEEAKLDYKKAAQNAVDSTKRRDYERFGRAACS